MKILALSDTHGNLEIINALALDTGADAVVHAGDFGFYDAESPGRLSERELNLHIRHSSLKEEDKRLGAALERAGKEEFIRDRAPLSELPDYLAGAKSFEVPVYAVWGNHEDIEVVRKFHTGAYRVENLHVLHEGCSHHLGKFHVFGLGGNFLKSRKLLQEPLAGGAGKVWSTLRQYAQLYETVLTDRRDGELGLFINHVSPGKEPFISAMGCALGADCVLSGHMGAPHTMVWNEFAIREPEEAQRRFHDEIEAICSLVREHGVSPGQLQTDFLETLRNLTSEQAAFARGHQRPHWFLDMHYVNLPDAHVGYALLEESGGRLRIEPRYVQRGIR